MTRDMTSGRPMAKILAFCGPLIIGNLFQQFYNLADSVIVGRLLGVNSFAAVGSTGSLNFFVLGFAIGICSGFTIPIAQSFGAGDYNSVRRRAVQIIWLGLAFSVVLTLLTYFTTAGILRLVNTPAEIFADAYRYIFIIFMGLGAIILYNLGAGVLRALGDSRTPLLFLVAAVIINVGLDILFMAGFGMGVEGAAYATVLSQAASGMGCIVYIWLKVPILRIRKDDMRPDWKDMGRITAIGVPMGLQFSITAIGSIILQSAVNSLGASAVASITAASRVHNIVASPLDTAGLAMATYCGQNLGAGKPGRIRAGMRCMTIAVMIYCAAAFTVNFFAGVPIARLFISSAQPSILAASHKYLMAISAAYPLLAIVNVYRNSLQGLGFSKSAMFAGLAELIGRTLAAFGLVKSLGFTGVCFADPMAWIFADCILLPMYFSKMRVIEKSIDSSRNNSVLPPAPAEDAPH